MPFNFDFVWLIVLIPAFYLVVPIFVWQHPFPAHPKLEQLDFEKIGRSRADFLLKQTAGLYALGFEEPTLVRMPNAAPNVTTFLIMLVNRQRGDKAMVTAIVGRAGPVALETRYVEFSTRFDSGAVFNTLNSSELLAFPPGPQTVRTQVPSIHEIEKLYELHQFVMNKHNIDGKKVVYEPGQALDYLVRYALQEVYERQIKRGRLYFDENKDAYCTTLKGAYLLTWGLTQPFKLFRVLTMHLREKRILEEFDETDSGN